MGNKYYNSIYLYLNLIKISILFIYLIYYNNTETYLVYYNNIHIFFTSAIIVTLIITIPLEQGLKMETCVNSSILQLINHKKNFDKINNIGIKLED